MGSTFDLVGAAEQLLHDAKHLVAAKQPGSGPENGVPGLRQRIAQTAKQIISETASPIDLVKADWVVLADVATLNIFQDWAAFDHIPLDGYISIGDLARAIDAEESLVARIAAHLVATRKLLPGPEPNTVAHSHVSSLYRTTHPVSALHAVAVGNGMKPYAHWPEYFRAYGRREPPPPPSLLPLLLPSTSTISASSSTSSRPSSSPPSPPNPTPPANNKDNNKDNTTENGNSNGTGTNRATNPPPNVTSSLHTPFAFSWHLPHLPPWEVKARHPSYARAFERSMRSREIVGGNTPLVGDRAVYDLSWVGEEAQRQLERQQLSVPAEGQEGNGQEGKKGLKAVVVDVGGGLGQLLRDVLRDVKGVMPGQCVLQDRGEVIAEARRRMEAREEGGDLKGVVMMEHDFHGEQPVKGALVYILRRILLDYSDTLATGILRQLADALPADNPRARVLIMEERRLEVPTPQNTIVDLVMLNLGGKLRNEAMFTDIATAAGLRVVGFYPSKTDATCVVECARA